jgi:hypothetical protein
MQTTSASGYVVKASAFTNLLPEPLREKFTQAIADKDVELVDEILGENAPKEFPSFETSFMLQPEGDADNLVQNEVYICFQDEDLYVLTPKPELNFLMANGIKPEFERWTTWG